MTDKKTAWKDNKSEATTARRLHIWIFSSLRIWAHLILQQESWKAQHKVRAMRDLYMKNTLSQRDIQSFFSQEILFYTNMAGGKKLAYEDDENSHKNSVPASFHLFSCYQFQVEQSVPIWYWLEVISHCFFHYNHGLILVSFGGL